MANLINDLGGPDGFGTEFLAANDDDSTGTIDVTAAFPDGINLFGHTYTSIYVNNNGNITFDGPLGTYTPETIGAGFTSPIIAPFWADVDTADGPVTSTGGSSAGSDLVWYNVDAASHTVTVTWDDVGYYAADDKVNAFQLQITQEPNGFAQIEFLYQTIQWTTGSASGGTDGLGGTPARVGYSAGNGVNYYEFPSSANQAALLALPTTPGNTGLPGIYVFQSGLNGIYSFANPQLNSPQTVTFGPRHVGDAPANQAVSITNAAAPPAEGLDATASSVASGLTETGSISLLVAGQTDSSSIHVGIDTSTPGLKSGNVTFALASDGQGTSGAGATALGSQTIAVTGTVFALAQAAFSNTSPILHVGDAGAETLKVGNTSGYGQYSEGLIAMAVGAAGAVSSASGTTGLIADGDQNTTSLIYDVPTGAVGQVSGTVDVALTSDGTGTSGLGLTSLGTQAVAINATIDNYATAQIVEIGGGATLAHSGNSYTLDLGTVVAGSTISPIQLGIENTASAFADLLEGSFTASGDGAIQVTGLTPFSGIAAQGEYSGLDVSLNTGTAGSFSEQIVMTPTGYNASGYAGTLQAETLTVTGTVTPLGLSISHITPDHGSDLGSVTMTIDGSSLNANDQVKVIGADGTTLVANDVRWVNSGEVWATFDLTGLPTGSYDVQVGDGTVSATLSGAFQVNDGPVGQVSVNLVLPQFTELGGDIRSGTGTIVYSNTGNTDVAAPILDVNSSQAVLQALGGAPGSNDIQILGTNASGPAGILPPGGQGSIVFTYAPTNPTPLEAIAFSVGTVAATSAGTVAAGVTLDWSGLEASLKPATVDETDWNNVWTAFTNLVGTTTTSLENALSAAATELSQVGQPTNDVATLLQYELFQASGAMAGTYLSTATDIAASSSTLSLSLTRYYDGTLLGRDAAGEFGDGWTSTYDVSAVTDASGNVYIQSPGAQHVFTLQADRTYTAAAGDPATLTVSGGLYQMSDGSGDIEKFRADGKLSSITDANGNVVNLTYNASGVLQQVTSAATGDTITFTSNAQGLITSAKDSDGQQVTYTYNAAGTQLLSATGPAGVTSYGYAVPTGSLQDNTLTSVTNPDGTQELFTYNSQGWLASQSGAGGAAAQTYTYNGPGQVTVTDALGNPTTLLYGATGDIARTQDALGNVTQLNYDSAGNLTQVVSPGGSTSSYSYNALGDLTGSTDPLGGTIRTTYSPGAQNLTGFTNQNDSQIQYTYDPAGNVTGITYQDGSGDTYDYNTQGLLTSSTDADGNTINYSYDSAGDLTREAFNDGASNVYTYDSRGNLLTATAQDGTTQTYTYSAANQLTSLTNSNGQVESYTYNGDGQLATRTEPDGSVTRYSYNANGQLAELRDGAGNLLDQYTYNLAGQLIKTVTGSGASTTYSYDADGRTTKILNLNADGSVASRYDYTYDANSQVVAESTSDGAWTYSYDASGELTSAIFLSTNSAVSNQNISYVYDAAGNRLSQTVNGVVTDYTTNALNQYTTVGGTTFTYDGNGNVVSETDSSGTTTFTYNQNNQLLSQTGPGQSLQYTYDALGNLVSTTDNGATTYYVNDPLAMSISGQPLTAVADVYNSSGTLTSAYDYGLGLAAESDGSGNISYYNTDLTGNVTGLIGSSGTLTSTYFYLPFGSDIQTSGDANSLVQFSGGLGVTTDGSGLDFMRARFYNPATGRFISPDPTGLFGGANLYAYTTNDPINAADPTGEFLLFVILPVIGGVIGGVSDALTYSPGQGWSWSWSGFERGAIAGAVGTTVGLLAGPELAALGLSSIAAGGVAGALNGATSNAIDQFIEHGDSFDNFSFSKLFASTALGGLGGSLFGKLPRGRPPNLLSLTSKFGKNSQAWALRELNSDLFSGVGNWITNLISSLKGAIASAFGCPYFTTFDGLGFWFQGAGEFVAAKSTLPGNNFQVQMRLEPEGSPTSSVSIITQIAVQVGNDRVTFASSSSPNADASRARVVWVDGAQAAISQANPIVTLAGGIIVEVSSNEYQVVLNTGEIVTVTPFGDGMGLNIQLAASDGPGSVQGFFGANSGQANDFQLPDGTVLQQPLTQDQLYQQFANAWRVTDATSLLDYGPGQTTATFTDTQYPREILTLSDFPPDVVANAMAVVAAAGITDPTLASVAAFDYITMGNPSSITEAATVAGLAPTTTSTAAVITEHVTPPPSIGVLATSASVVEAAGTVTPVTFNVNLTSSTTTDTVVDYTLTPGVSNSGLVFLTDSDFGGTGPSGAVTIAAGQTVASFTIDVPNNAISAVPDKLLQVSISSPSGDFIYGTLAQSDIVNNAPVAGPAAAPVIELLAGTSQVPSEFPATLTQSGNDYTLNLGQVLSNTAIPPLQFAIANMATAPADGLTGTISIGTGSGFLVSGTQQTGTILPGNAFQGLTITPQTGTLGAQSQTLTFASSDINSTGYSASLPDLTLTLNDTVVAPAQPILNSQSINFPSIHLGSPVSQTITVTNSATPPAADLDVIMTPGSSVVASGSISQLAPGATDPTDLSVSLPAAAVGPQTGTVALNFFSDLGNGETVSALPTQDLTLSGTVYREAAAALLPLSEIVHVGDPGTASISVSNSDPNDGYSESLIASLLAASGGIDIASAGPTGDIAAGASDTNTLGISFSTAQAGTISGTGTIGLISDGGTGPGSFDGLGQTVLPDGTVPVSIAVDNYAKAELTSDGNLTSNGLNAFTLNLGSTAEGSAALTANLAVLNDVLGPADWLSGTFAASGSGPFSNAGFGTFGTLGAGGSLLAGSISLATNAAGVYSETVTLTPMDSNATGFSEALAPQTVTVTGTIVSTASANGDVHMVTYDGLHYDFQADGSYILTRSTVPGDNFQIQIATAPDAANHAVSFTTLEAAQVGRDVVTFGIDRATTVWIDGTPDTALSADGPAQTLDGGELEALSATSFRLTWSTGQTLTVTNQGPNLDTSVALGAAAQPGTVQGLLGTASGETANDFQLPDGTVLRQPLSGQELYGTFADAWSVTAADSLLEGRGVTTEDDPTIVPAAIGRLGGADVMQFLYGDSIPQSVEQASAPYQVLSANTVTNVLSDTSGFGVIFQGTLQEFADQLITGVSARDLIDITDLDGSSISTSYAGSTNAGVLHVSDGTHSGELYLSGQLTDLAFHATPDGHGGSLISLT